MKITILIIDTQIRVVPSRSMSVPRKEMRAIRGKIPIAVANKKRQKLIMSNPAA
jgi:hypothetical protein